MIVPAYNEEARITRSLPLLARFLDEKPYSWEVIVVDDGSSDATGALVCEWAERTVAISVWNRYPTAGRARRSDTACCLRGANAASCVTQIWRCRSSDWTIFSGLIAAGIGRCDRIQANGRGATLRASHRGAILLGRAFNVVVQCLVVRGFNDTQCGFKCFRGNAADTLFGLQRTMGWTFDVEILYLARKKAMRVVELPIECHYDDTSKMRTLPAALTVLRDILTLWWRTIVGAYAGDDGGAPDHRDGQRT